MYQTSRLESKRARALVLMLALLGTLAALAPAHAVAGEYTVTACDPQVAGGANRSWVAEIAHGGMAAYAVCPAGARAFDQGLVTRHAVVGDNTFATVPGFANAAWVLRAPPGTALVRTIYDYSLCAGSDFNAGLYNGANQMLQGASNACGSLAPAPASLPLNDTNAIKIMTICAKSTCNVGRGLQAYFTVRSITVTLRDDAGPQVAITGGALVDGRWHRDTSSVDVSAADNVGVGLVQAIVDGQANQVAAHPCGDPTLLVRCTDWSQSIQTELLRVPDGRHQVAVRATDATGNVAISSSRTILVDNTAPARPVGFGVEGGAGWRGTNRFDLTWTNPDAANGSPVASLLYELCPGGNAPTDKTRCASGRRPAPKGAVKDFTVPGPGEWRARFWLEDEAGNHNPGTAEEVRLAFDADAPKLAFLDQDPPGPGPRLRV